MDENADLRLTIETARKNKNWARRCYAYELALEYFTITDADCYEMCSYCDSIVEFLDERNEHCLMRALRAVKMYVSRCVDAPTIAKTVTRAIIEKIFLTRSNRLLDLSSDIIMEFIEWEAYDVVLRELMSGAQKYGYPIANVCIQVMREALKDFGPQVICIYKLINFIERLVTKNLLSDLMDECSRLLIQMYQWTGPQIRVHLVSLLDPQYLSTIEEGYEEVKDLPVFYNRFVRYHNEIVETARESEEEVFATCKIAQQKPEHPLEGPGCLDMDDEVSSDVEGTLMLGLDEIHFMEDVERELNDAMALVGVLDEEDKLGNIPEPRDYLQAEGILDQINFEELLEFEQEENNELYNCENEITYDLNSLDDKMLFSNDEYDYEYENDLDEIYERALKNTQTANCVETLDVSCQSGVKLLDGVCQTKRIRLSNEVLSNIFEKKCFSDSRDPYETILTKLFDKYGTEEILVWLRNKFFANSNKTQLEPNTEEGTKSKKSYPLHKVMLVQEEIARREKTGKELKRSLSESAGYDLSRRCAMCLYNFTDRIMFNYRQNLRCYSPSLTDKESNTKYEAKSSTSEIKRPLRQTVLSRKKTSSMTATFNKHFESEIVNNGRKQRTTGNDTNQILSTTINRNSELKMKKNNLISRFFQKLRFLRLKNSDDKTETNGIWKRFSLSRYSKDETVSRKTKSHCNSTTNEILITTSNLMSITKKSSEKRSNLPISSKPKLRLLKKNVEKFNKEVNNLENIEIMPEKTGNYATQRTVSDPFKRRNGSQAISNLMQRPVSELMNFESSIHFSRSSDIPTVRSSPSGETICVSDDASITEINPNICCYYFQKNSIRRLLSRSCEGNLHSVHTTDCNAGSSTLDRCTVGYRVDKLTAEPGKSDYSRSYHSRVPLEEDFRPRRRHRGSGDELSYSSLNRQLELDHRVGDDLSSANRRQKLFCCISMNDYNDETCQFEIYADT